VLLRPWTLRTIHEDMSESRESEVWRAARARARETLRILDFGPNSLTTLWHGRTDSEHGSYTDAIPVQFRNAYKSQSVRHTSLAKTSVLTLRQRLNNVRMV